ncbi:peptidoglycan-binding protein [Streptomyces cinnabarinus]|uniref:Peptidoglycan-binding protein n=1 Tax=Streptomyces cinnabarinus TaxID=67287 RepID=A0ABY7KQL0_9ACTN|nr:peptidoglycan-binding domain-containing protein [Streptomyces cinnabarinus]WAZ25945.1 peptidoglycan-binding protein [Streptomyces cinnabarinus]
MENTDPPLEPARVLRPRRTDALADLFREPAEDSGPYEPVPLPTPPHGSDADTQELPPVPAAAPVPAPEPGGRPRSGRVQPRAAVAVAVTAAALLGFGAALALPQDKDEGRPEAGTAPAPPATSSPTPTPTPTPTDWDASDPNAPDPDGPGTLREGDSGPEVIELQQRLLAVPDVYTAGSASGVYDATLREAVARFQLWYGISGDETGVYGNDTRRSLESRNTRVGG